MTSLVERHVNSRKERTFGSKSQASSSSSGEQSSSMLSPNPNSSSSVSESASLAGESPERSRSVSPNAESELLDVEPGVDCRARRAARLDVGAGTEDVVSMDALGILESWQWIVGESRVGGKLGPRRNSNLQL